MNNVKIIALALSLVATNVAWSDVKLAGNANHPKADSHAPIGVMGDHIHGKGEWMLSYRYMSMSMEDNLQGDDSISPEEIATTLVNPYAGPPTVRVVPVDMTTQMHMFGLMYAPSDTITLMAMVNYLEKEMDHITFMGTTGTTRLGTFTTEASGVGDTKLAMLWGLFNNGTSKLHLNIGLSLPTGDIEESGTVLTPMNTEADLRLPYAMQLGSGTFDLEPGVTYTGYANRLSWGGQYMASLRLSENDEDYTLGDIHKLSAWGGYRLADWVGGSLRISYRDEGEIDGRDELIGAPVQTANPDNYGGERIDLGLGFNFVTHSGHRFAFEYEVPIQQDLNGVQMEMQSMLTLGYQYAF